MDFKFDNNLPIHIQLVEQIKFQIISGKLKIGERLPSVRELALNTKVNPNTMQKALGELEDMGLVFTERTNGKFVTQDKDLLQKIRKEYAFELSKSFYNNMKNLGYSNSEIINYITDMEEK